jgi:hypothetical protein
MYFDYNWNEEDLLAKKKKKKRDLSRCSLVVGGLD